jgi:undecaprenyl-diphosphatase
MASVDTEVLDFFVRHRQPWLSTVARGVTLLGNSAVLIPLVLIVGLVMWRRRRTWTPLVVLAAAYAGAELLFQTLKAIVGRARPPSAVAIGHFTGTAFPSGHATLSAAVFGALAALVPGRRRAAGLAAAGIALMVGVTRLYLGAHWLTDVLAGWALGAGWLALVIVTPRAVTSSRSTSPSPDRASSATSTP